ncbi:hypothetical protein N6H18_04455 [Reichenbachiella agarivorans]|uniref:Uncharacterized protein n=1 Tax=Reichenbachiella agarivorans TaxID=2979464 RepID=A0ABY6CRR4_9BACT|nr:hypothetical protein [Reichenbachiella agarivorans]UXP33204.1 hypothetical protein N6H18_04455 [Reichenbachiella agarivorans]
MESQISPRSVVFIFETGLLVCVPQTTESSKLCQASDLYNNMKNEWEVKKGVGHTGFESGRRTAVTSALSRQHSKP